MTKQKDINYIHSITEKLLNFEPVHQDRMLGVLYLMLSRAMYVEDDPGTNIALDCANQNNVKNYFQQFISLLEKEQVGISRIVNLGDHYKRVELDSELTFYFFSGMSKMKGINFSYVYFDEA
jgi:hypothetical protein